jgi:hypothetical protein
MSELTFVGLPAERNAALTIVPGKRRLPPYWRSLGEGDLRDLHNTYQAESRNQGHSPSLRVYCRAIARRVRVVWLRKLYSPAMLELRGYRCRLENRPDDTVRWYVRSADGELMHDARSRELSAKAAWDEAREVIARKDGVLA